MLQPTLDQPAEFSFWLKLLHVLLLLPLFLAWLIPSQPRIDGTLIYFALGAATTYWHVSSLVGPPYVTPVTDCQISITTDLACCTLITLYMVYVQTNGSLFATAIAGVAAPLISPAAVLAFHLAFFHLADTHAAFVTAGQQAVAKTLGGGGADADVDARVRALNGVKADAAAAAPAAPGDEWTNLGLWEADDDESGDYGSGETEYQAACKRLAMKLGSAVLEQGDAVLATGCGSGAELDLYKAAFELRHITGLDSDPSAAARFEPSHNVRLLHKEASEMVSSFLPTYFNKIVALDNVYHYASKEAYFVDAAAMLPSGGMVGVTDVVVKNGSAPLWIKLALKLANIPMCNLWNLEEYRAKLNAAGFDEIVTESIGDRVLPKWLPQSFLPYLDYVVISATKAPSCKPESVGNVSGGGGEKLKVAVIGSGLAGLTAAHNLSDKLHDVTIYESRPLAGLSGNSTKVHGQVVDIPLRMIGQGYYNYVQRLAASSGVPTVPARADCSFYGDDGKGGVEMFKYAKSRVANFFQCLPYMLEGMKLRKAVEDAAHLDESSTLTYGEWMAQNGYYAAGGSRKGHIMSMWLMTGQMSWVLSCTYEQLKGYPAKIVLDFIRGLQLSIGSMLSFDDNGPKIVRIYPSIDALQLAMAYGSELVVGNKISNINADRTILGEHYDKVIVATEAMAVQHVVEDADEVFNEVVYQPSAIVLHTDKSFMPAKRSDWLPLNVEQQPVGGVEDLLSTQDMSQLTVWLNEYYPDVRFPEETFQTWNPLRRPKNVTKQVNFMRVVHTANTPRILKEIADLQGQDGIYYAGSYCVFGMGLLEQAALSGQLAAELISAECEREE